MALPQVYSSNKANTTFELAISDFSSGINMMRDSTSIAPNQARFSVNVTTNLERDLSTQLGFTRVGQVNATAVAPWFLDTLNQSNGQDIQVRIINNPAGAGVVIETRTTGNWTQLGLAFGTNSDRTKFRGGSLTINGNDYLYVVNGVSTLRRISAAGHFAIQNSSLDIICKYICIIQNVIVLGNFTATHNSNDVIWSEPGTEQFYRNIGDNPEDFTTTSNIAPLTGAVSQLIAPSIWNNLVYAFTENDGLNYVDVFKGTVGTVFDIGTISPESVTFGEGMMVWVDPQVRVWAYQGSGIPVRLSRNIDRLIQQMNPVNIPNICAGICNSLLRIWIGDITNLNGVTGDNYVDVELEYDIQRSRERTQHLWRVNTNIPVSRYTNYTDQNNFQKQYIASNVKTEVYVRESGTTYNGTTISSIYRTPSYKTGTALNLSNPQRLYIKYVPLGDANAFITVKYALDTSKTYTTWITNLSAQKLGMGDSANYEFIERYVGFPPNVRCQEISLEFSSTAKIDILEMRIEGTLAANNIKPSTT